MCTVSFTLLPYVAGLTADDRRSASASSQGHESSFYRGSASLLPSALPSSFGKGGLFCHSWMCIMLKRNSFVNCGRTRRSLDPRAAWSFRSTSGSPGSHSMSLDKVRTHRPTISSSIHFHVAAFDFNFGALDNDRNEVSQAYNNML